MADIRVSAQVWAQLKERLLVLHPDLEDDSATLFDTLDGLTDFQEVAVALFESAQRDKVFAEALAGDIATRQERKARFMARSEAKRAALCQAMQDADCPKIEAPAVTLSLRRYAPAVVIEDANRIPRTVIREGGEIVLVEETVVRKPIKDAIKDLINAGLDVPGCAMGNGGITLSVRTK